MCPSIDCPEANATQTAAMASTTTAAQQRFDACIKSTLALAQNGGDLGDEVVLGFQHIGSLLTQGKDKRPVDATICRELIGHARKAFEIATIDLGRLQQHHDDLKAQLEQLEQASEAAHREIANA